MTLPYHWNMKEIEKRGGDRSRNSVGVTDKHTI